MGWFTGVLPEYRHTSPVSVVRRDQEIDPEAAEYLPTLNREETKQYDETHQHPMDRTIHQQHRGGRPFLDHVYLRAGKIDQLRSETDRSDLRLERIKANLMGHMGLPKDGRAPGDWLPMDPAARRLRGRFLHLLANIRRLKQLRLEPYAKIRAVKKSWFGYAVNRIVERAKKHDAAVVREALDIVTEERLSPACKGRTFSKMIDAGAQGQFNARLVAAPAWLGRLLIKIPAYDSSTSCEIHSRVDRRMRRSAVFRCPPCGKRLDAEAHGSETPACFLLLRPGVHAPGP